MPIPTFEIVLQNQWRCNKEEEVRMTITKINHSATIVDIRAWICVGITPS